MNSFRFLSQIGKKGIERNINRKVASSSELFSRLSLQSDHDQPNLALIGASWGHGQKHTGVANGPDFLRQGGLVRSLIDLGYNIQDYGNIQTELIEDDVTVNNVRLPRTGSEQFKKISKHVEKALKSDAVCLTIGGDHSIAMGTVHGHAQVNEDLCVIWVDAHADINPPQASDSGNMHGMPLAFLVKEMEQYTPAVPGFEWLKPCLNAKNLAYIGLRDVDTAERYIIESLGIPSYTILDIDRFGIDECLEDALNLINPKGDKPIHLSFDIDACDPVLAPSTGTPVSGGLTMREALYIVERLSATGNLKAVDMVEVNPELGTSRDQQTTLQSALDIILACFGKRGITQMPRGYRLPLPCVS